MGSLNYKGPTHQEIILVFGGVPVRIHVIEILDVKENGSEEISEEVTAENFLKLVRHETRDKNCSENRQDKSHL